MNTEMKDTQNKSTAALVDITGLSKGYEEAGSIRQVLTDLNLEIYQGELVILFGRSGSGKSTLLNLIGGIDSADRGSIRIGTSILTELDEHNRTLFRRENIGFIFQSFNLIPTLNVKENILLPLQLKGLTDQASKEKAFDFLDQVGLLDRADTFPDRLSGGEQQRVAIARALAHDPLIILADEPTGNLDYTSAEQIRSILYKLCKQSGKTILIATHDRDMYGIADRVLQLQEGELVESNKTTLNADE
jgi:putative ABC transport system ATP-binding protein